MGKIPQEDCICPTCKTNYKHTIREMTRQELNDSLATYKAVGWKYEDITPGLHLMALLALECSWKERDKLKQEIRVLHLELDDVIEWRSDDQKRIAELESAVQAEA